MNSTPDEHGSPAEEPDEPAVRPPEPVEPASPVLPPTPDVAPAPAPSRSEAPLPPPGPVVHPQQQPPAPPHAYAAGAPMYPAQQYPGQTPADAWQSTPRRGLSFGAGLAIGLGIGVLAHGLAIFLMFASVNVGSGAPEWLVMLWPYILVALVGAAMMFFPKTRSFATGILIIAAAMWLTVIGPCIALIGAFSV